MARWVKSSKDKSLISSQRSTIGLLNSVREELEKPQISEEESLKQALANLAEFAAKQPSYHQPNCILISKSLDLDEKKRLLDELKSAGIVVKSSIAETQDIQKLNIEKTNFGIEAKLQKLDKTTKSFILSGSLRIESTWSLMREMHDIDQRKTEISKIAKRLRANKYSL